MGIPGFYRWITAGKNRAAVAKVVEDPPNSTDGVTDTTKPNPNGVEFDNLYLDMNGIIHPCFHPDEEVCAPGDYEEVFIRVFHYIDRIFSMIRPRQLLFMAIDGVAPRAKMNQQRARRFKAIKEASDAMGMHGGTAHSSVSKGLDSNIITPGTEFMELLSSALQYYIHLRMNEDPGWEGVKVILSDASVPGEGEQKIMSYIRLQRNLPGYNPNTRHCFYGMDADLIMLALATHEIHFSVLREVQVQRGGSKGDNTKKKRKKRDRILFYDFLSRQRFEFLHMWILRECLTKMLQIPDRLVKVDLERLIDDFVFMCLFVGNDFLPHVPSLDISKGAIDLLIEVYKKEFARMGGYLTDSSEVNLERLAHFVQILGSHENAIFKKQAPRREKKRQRDPRFVEDNVNLGEDGWKERYYNEKFKIKSDADQEAVKKHAVVKYVEGICWVMRYYYQGVCSWQWFYPYHYAPFASDFHGLDQLKIEFVLGEPFKPFNQLMAVLPAASAHALPQHYRNLMTNSSSPILDFYPTEFERDLNGKKQPWKAVCRLPFIDEGRLLAEIAKVEHTLTDAERQRNTFGIDKLFIHMSHALATKVFAFFGQNKDNPRLHKINPESSGGMNGYLYISDKPICPADVPSPIRFLKQIMNNKVVLLFYQCPEFHPHIARPPEGVVTHQKPIGCPKVVRPTLCDAKTSNQTGLTTRYSPCMTAKEIAKKYVETWKFIKEAKLKKKLNPTCLACNIGYPLGRMRRDVLKVYLNHTCSNRRIEKRALKVKKCKTELARKQKSSVLNRELKKAALASNGKEGEVRKQTDDAQKDNTTKTDDAQKDKITKTEHNRRKRKRYMLNKGLRKASLASNGEKQGEIEDNAQKDNTTKTDDAQKDNTAKTERNRRKKKKYILNKKLRKASLASNGEEQGEIEETTRDALNAELESSRQGVLQNMINCTQNDNKGKGKLTEEGKLNSACLVNRIEVQGQAEKMANDAVNDKSQGEVGKTRLSSIISNNTTKVDNTCLVGKNKGQGENSRIKLDNPCLVNSSGEQGEAGKITASAVNDNSKKKKRAKKKRKLDIACSVAGGVPQVEVGKTTHDGPKENSTIKLDNSCLLNKTEEQGEAGNMMNVAVNDKSQKKRRRGNKKGKLDSACLITTGVHQVEVGETTHDGQKENSTTKLDNSCLVNRIEVQGEAEKMANDDVNDKSQKKRKRGDKKRKSDGACLVASGVHQVEVGQTTNDGPKDNSTVKLDYFSLVNRSDEQGEAGKMTNDAVHDKSQSGNKKSELHSACLVPGGVNQVEVGKTTQDAPKENSIAKLANGEEQGNAGKRRRVNKKRILDSASLVPNGEDQVKVTNGENQAEVGRTNDDTTRQGFVELWNLLQAAMSQTRGPQTEI